MEQATSFRYVGFWWRVLAYLLDSIVANVILTPIMFLFIPFVGLSSDPFSMMGAMLVPALAFVCLYAMYEAAFTASKMRATPFKYMLGMAVVTEKGERLHFMQGIARHAAKAVSAMVLCIGFLMVAFTDRKRGLHDMMCGTVVVKRDSLPVTVEVVT